MSARVESTPVRESPSRPIVIAVVAALGLGALAVGMVRLTADDGPAAVSTRAPLWDTQKLEAMEGRQLAAQVEATGTVVPSLEPGQLKAILEGRPFATQPVLWDAAKLEAMEGRQLAAQVETHPALWDTGKLEAMEGRQLATAIGAEDPIVTPHVPRRAPGA